MDINAQIEAKLAAALAMPHTHEIVWTYLDGKEERFTTRSLLSAENFADERRYQIGRDLINRETGETSRIVSVIVRPIVESV
jgi:hypothetical protein